MARPSDEDSGVLSLQELAPRFSNSNHPQHPPEPQSPFWSSQLPVAAPPYAQAPQTWSSGQWAVPLQPIEPPHYTPRPIGMGMRRPRRWGLRFMMVFGLVGLGAFLARDHLPPFPRSLAQASTSWESLTASVRRATATLTGKPVPRVETPPAPAVHAARGPQIVPLPSGGATPAPAPVAAEVKARPRPQPESAPEPAAARPRVAAPVHTPVRVASVSRPPASHKANDPFESDAAAAAALSKPLKTPVGIAAPREAPAPVAVAHEPKPVAHEAKPAVREAKPVPGSLDDLMSSSLKKPVPTRSNKEIDRRLAGVNESRDAEPARKKADAEPAPAHALTRNEIQTVMHAVQAKVSTDCYQKFQQNGPADLKMVVSGGGSVTSVAVSGPFAGTPTGACVERAVKGATFPESAGLHFDYRISVR